MTLPDGPYNGTKVTIAASGLVTIDVYYVATTFEDIFRIWLENPTFLGLRRSRNAPALAPQRQAGSYDLTISYEGYVPDADPEDNPESKSWRVTPEWSEEPIESNVAYEQIKQMFGGFLDGEDRLKFPEYIELPNTVGGPSPFRKGKKIKNPMFGRETFFQTGSIVELTEIVRSVPVDLVRNVNRIRKTLPIEDLRHVDWGDRDWFEMQPDVQSKGDVVELVRRWKMSAPGGWPPAYLLVDQR